MVERNMISIFEAENITGIGGRTIRRMCGAGEIDGAVYFEHSRMWTVPRAWAESRRPEGEEDFLGYMPLASAARIAEVTREAMHQAIERGAVIGKFRMVNKRRRWWVSVSDESFGRYVQSQDDRRKHEDLDGQQMYSFHHYIVDRGLLGTRKPTLEDERVLWDAHGDAYISYCKDHGYDFERI